MRINHLIVGCEDVKKSQDFYTRILGFDLVSSFMDTGTKKEGLVLLDTSSGSDVEILLVPFNGERLPSPQHLAFEIDSKKFDSIFNTANEMKLDIRSLPPLDCKTKGIGTTEVRGKNYERFYLLDPSRVNIEFMRLC